MEKVLEILRNRRVIAGIVGAVAFGFYLSGKVIDTETAITLGHEFALALAVLIEAGLALWSYIQPKK